MADQGLRRDDVLRAFEALGEAIGGYDDIEIVLVGGMAGRLGGWLDPLQTTSDCDVMAYVPEGQMGYVEQEAFNIGRKLGLPSHWLNSQARMFEWVLPPGWESRKHPVGRFGLVVVSHVGRLDFATLKVFASRDLDRAHLLAMNVTVEEIDFSEKHLLSLQDRPMMTPEKFESVRDTIEILRSRP